LIYRGLPCFLPPIPMLLVNKCKVMQVKTRKLFWAKMRLAKDIVVWQGKLIGKIRVNRGLFEVVECRIPQTCKQWHVRGVCRVRMFPCEALHIVVGSYIGTFHLDNSKVVREGYARVSKAKKFAPVPIKSRPKPSRRVAVQCGKQDTFNDKVRMLGVDSSIIRQAVVSPLKPAFVKVWKIYNAVWGLRMVAGIVDGLWKRHDAV